MTKRSPSFGPGRALGLVAALLLLPGAALAQLGTAGSQTPMAATMSAAMSDTRAQATHRGAQTPMVDQDAAVVVQTPEGETVVDAVTPRLLLVLQGDAALRTGEFAAALGRYEQALAMSAPQDPERVDVLLRVGMARAVLGDCAGALAAVRGTGPALDDEPGKTGDRRDAYTHVVSRCGGG